MPNIYNMRTNSWVTGDGQITLTGYAGGSTNPIIDKDGIIQGIKVGAFSSKAEI